MSHEQRRPIDIAGLVRAQRARLREFIDTDSGLLRELLALRVLNYQQVHIIKNESWMSNRVDKLLDFITDVSHELQRKFLLALYKSSQIHINNFILANGHRTPQVGENWPFGDYHKSSMIFSKLPELSKNIDTQNGLLDELLSVGCINEEQKQQVEVQNTNANRNEALLTILFRRSVRDYNEFVGCLVKTKQFQVAYSLEAGTLRGQTPLNEVQRSTLVRNRLTLVELIENRPGLVEQMYADDCITWRQKHFIETASSQPQRNMRLLDIVERGSQSDFNKFLECLEATGQKHVCSILTTDPAVALMVAKTGCIRTLVYSRTRPLMNVGKKSVSQNERLIVKRFKSLLSHLSGERREQVYDNMNQFMRELRNRDVQAIAATRHSIELYFTCMSLDGLFYLECAYSSGEFSAMLGSLFTALLDNGQCVTVRSLVWEISNYVECAQHLCSGAGLVLHREMYQLMRHNRRTDTLSMHHALRIDLLPLEQKEVMLFKALRQLYVMFSKLTQKAEVYTLILLSSVSEIWWRAIFSRIFYLQSLQRHFSRVCHPFKSIPQQLKSLQVEKEIVNGVTEFNNKLFVICRMSITVHVFNSNLPFNRFENIEVRGLINPVDTVVCNDTSQLYIADYDQCAIWRVNLLSYKQVDKFISTQWKPNSLSTKSRRLLIIPRDGDALFIYGDDGVLLKHIQLPRYMAAAHAVETTHNTYIVTHESRLGRGDTLLTEHESVSEVDINGRVVHTFNGQHNDIGSIQFNRPWYLALAGNNHVIIADTRNERIVVLNEDLQLKRVLINSSHGQQPWRLCLSQRTGLLFIAMLDSSDINLYDVFQI